MCVGWSHCRSSFDHWGQQIISLAPALWWSQCTTWFLFPLLQWQFDLFKFNYASISPIVDRWSSILNPCVGSWHTTTLFLSLSLSISVSLAGTDYGWKLWWFHGTSVQSTFLDLFLFSARFRKSLIWLSTFVDVADRQTQKERERKGEGECWSSKAAKWWSMPMPSFLFPFIAFLFFCFLYKYI